VQHLAPLLISCSSPSWLLPPGLLSSSSSLLPRPFSLYCAVPLPALLCACVVKEEEREGGWLLLLLS
jgi:hypothetical protein